MKYFKDAAGEVWAFEDTVEVRSDLIPMDPTEIRAHTYVDPLQQVRARRNALLSQCDWTQLPDATCDKAAWSQYRQQLRDITKLAVVVWPTPPV